jgi:hypothetical protein
MTTATTTPTEKKEKKERSEWYYLDKNEVEQGPFTFSEMQAWWSGGYPSVIFYSTYYILCGLLRLQLSHRHHNFSKTYSSYGIWNTTI